MGFETIDIKTEYRSLVDNIVTVFDQVQIPDSSKTERRRWGKTHLHADREREGGGRGRREKKYESGG